MATLNEDHLGIVLAAFFSAFFYALFLVALALYLQSLACVRKLSLPGATRNFTGRILPIACVIMAVVATAGVINSLLCAVRYFAYDQAQTEGGKQSKFEKVSEMFLVFNVFIALIIADITLIYRCYKVYGSSWRIILLPSFFVVVGVASFCVLVRVRIPARGYGIWDTPAIIQAGIVAWSSTILTNVMTTGLLVWKIRQGMKEVAGISSSTKSLYKVSRILIESGMLSTTFTVASALAYLFGPTSSNLVFGTSEVQIVGISFTLIAYRVNKERIADDASFSSSSAPRLDPSMMMTASHSIHFQTTTTLTMPGAAAKDMELGSPRPTFSDVRESEKGSESSGALRGKC